MTMRIALMMMLLSGLIVSGCVPPKTTTPATTPATQETTTPEDADTTSTTPTEEEETVATNVHYEEYSEEAFAEAKGKGPVVLFFHAVWCPTCKQLDKVISENLAQIQGNARIFKVDYDSETALKQAHGVTLQHTLVGFDASGEQTAKSVGAILTQPALEEFLSQL